MKGPVGFFDQLAGFLPAIARAGLLQRRVTVVVVQFIQSEQPPLEFIEAGHQVVARGHRLDQRLDHLVADLVGQVAALDPGPVATQAVVRGLIGQHRVEDVGQLANAWLEPFRKGQRRLPPHLPVRVVQFGQHLLLGQQLAVQFKAQAAEELIEEPGPGVPTGNALFGENLFFRFAEQVRTQPLLQLQVVPIGSQRLGLHELAGTFRLDGRPFQLQKQQLLRSLRIALPHMLQERTTGRILRIGAPVQVGVGVGAAQPVQNHLVAAQCFGQFLGLQRANPAVIGSGKCLGFGQRLLQILLQRSLIRVQIGQIPANVFSSGLHTTCLFLKSPVARNECAQETSHAIPQRRVARSRSEGCQRLLFSLLP